MTLRHPVASDRRRCSPSPAFSIAATLAVLAIVTSGPCHGAGQDPPLRLAVRLDDVGMCHTVNSAVREVIASGIPFSVSVMTACPWYLEAVEILSDHPEVGVGIHLTLNSEWQHYRWGPVLGRSRVPSLVDGDGYFFASEAEFAAHEVDPAEVRAELRAQIERALRRGLRVDYLDGHMLTAFSTPQLTAIVEELAAEFGLGISRYFGEHSASLWDVAPEQKLPTLLRFVDRAESGLTLLVIHPGLDTPEMTALVDMNYLEDPFRVGRHRQAEIDALTSPAFRTAVAARGLRLVTYQDIVQEHGLAAMARPAVIGGYTENLVGDR